MPSLRCFVRSHVHVRVAALEQITKCLTSSCVAVTWQSCPVLWGFDWHFMLCFWCAVKPGIVVTSYVHLSWRCRSSELRLARVRLSCTAASTCSFSLSKQSIAVARNLIFIINSLTFKNEQGSVFKDYLHLKAGRNRRIMQRFFFHDEKAVFVIKEISSWLLHTRFVWRKMQRKSDLICYFVLLPG